jgi:hypothetical protein
MHIAMLVFMLSGANGRSTTISNALPRLDTAGNFVNAHSGNIVVVNGTYFLYGEHYPKFFTTTQSSAHAPRLAVYTSTDLATWEFGGTLHNNTPGAAWADSGQWPGGAKDEGGWWCPWAVHDAARARILLYFTATPAACCDAYWGVAQSFDGVHFELLSLNETGSGSSGGSPPPPPPPAVGSSSIGGSSLGGSSGASSSHLTRSKDGNAVLIDDDGTGYIAYTIMNPDPARTPGPGAADHRVAIDALAPDLASSSKVQVGAIFADDYVEGVMLFKRKGLYYVVYSSCCCACRGGSGAVVHYASNISGPWTRQVRDANCGANDVPNMTMCAGGFPPDGFPSGQHRPAGMATIAAQGLGLSVIPLAGGGAADDSAAYLWAGERWLSGPGNPTNCTTLCSDATGECAQPAGYDKGSDFSYWYPLQFAADGRVRDFEPFVDAFTLELP